MTLHFRETPEKIIVCFPDARDLDEARIHEIGKSLLSVCNQAADANKRLIVDFRGISFMSFAMIGKLILLNKLAKQNSLDLRLANINPNVFQEFMLMRINDVFRFDDDDPDLLGAGVPLPKPPGTLEGRAEPPSN